MSQAHCRTSAASSLRWRCRRRRRPRWRATSNGRAQAAEVRGQERFNAEQTSLLEEAIDADLEALAPELERLVPTEVAAREKQQPKRQALPAQQPRREVRHEPASTTCACGCALRRIG